MNKLISFIVIVLVLSIPISVSDAYAVESAGPGRTTEARSGEGAAGLSDVPNSKSSFDNDGDGVCDKSKEKLAETNWEKTGSIAEFQRQGNCIIYDSGDMCIDAVNRFDVIRTGDEWIGCSRAEAEKLVDYWSIKLGDLSPTRIKTNWLTDQDYIYVYQPITLTPNPVITTFDVANIEIEDVTFYCMGLESYHTSLSEIININSNEKILKIRVSRFTEEELKSQNILTTKDNKPRTVKELEVGCRTYIRQHKLDQRTMPLREMDEFKFIIPIETLAIQPPDSALKFGVSASQAIIDSIDKIYPAVANARKIAQTLCFSSVALVLTTKFFGVWIDALDNFARTWWYGIEKLGGGLTKEMKDTGGNIITYKNEAGETVKVQEKSVGGGWIGGKAFCRYYACPIDWCPLLNDKDIPISIGVKDKTGLKTITLAQKMKEEGKTIQDSIVLSMACQCISGIELNLMRIRIIMEQWNKCLNLALQNKEYVAQCEKYLSYHLCQYVVGEFGSNTGRGIIGHYLSSFFKYIGLFGKKEPKPQVTDDPIIDIKELNEYVPVDGSVYKKYTIKTKSGKEYEAIPNGKGGYTNIAGMDDWSTAVGRDKTFLADLNTAGTGYAQGNIGYQSIGRTICEAAFYQRLPYGEVLDRFGLKEGIRWETSVIGEFSSEVAYQVPVENTTIYNYKIYYNLIAGSENFRYRVYLESAAGQRRYDLPGASGVLRSVGDYKTDYLEITDVVDYENICFDLENEVPRIKCFPEGKFSQGNPLDVSIDPWEKQDTTTVDSDGDRLPDVWEDLWNGKILSDGSQIKLSKTNKDSDSNGITDDKEDFDKDGFTNYREYQTNGDPLVPGKNLDGQYVVTDCKVKDKLDGEVISGKSINAQYTDSGTKEKRDYKEFNSGESVVINVNPVALSSNSVIKSPNDVKIIGEITGPNSYYLHVSEDYETVKAAGGKLLLWQIPSDAFTGVYTLNIQLATSKALFGFEPCTVDNKGTVSGFEVPIVIYNSGLNLCTDSDSENSNEKGVCISPNGDVSVDSCSDTILTEYMCAREGDNAGKCAGQTYPCETECVDGKCQGKAIYAEEKYKEVMAEKEKAAVSGLVLIAIDAGHGSGESGEETVGGSGPGTSAKYNGETIYEWKLNWDIANKLINELNKIDGVVAFKTRSGQENVAFTSRIDTIMGTHKRPADLVISIHANGNKNPGVNGMWILYDNDEGNYEKSTVIAIELFDILKLRFNNAQLKVAEPPNVNFPSLSILMGNNVKGYPPAILIEAGFMSNQDELALLINPDYQDEIIKQVKDYIIKYKDSSTTPIVSNPSESTGV